MLNVNSLQYFWYTTNSLSKIFLQLCPFFKGLRTGGADKHEVPWAPQAYTLLEKPEKLNQTNFKAESDGGLWTYRKD